MAAAAMSMAATLTLGAGGVALSTGGAAPAAASVVPELKGCVSPGIQLVTRKEPTPLRKGHSPNAPLIEKLAKGTGLIVVRSCPQNGWYQVMAGAVTGWVDGTDVKIYVPPV